MGSWLPDCSVQVSILLRPPPLLLSQLDRRAGLLCFQCSAAAAATAAESLISSKEWLASTSAHHPSASDRSEVELRIGRRFFRIGCLRRQSGHPGHISPESQPFSHSFFHTTVRKIAILYVSHKQNYCAITHNGFEEERISFDAIHFPYVLLKIFTSFCVIGI